MAPGPTGSGPPLLPRLGVCSCMPMASPDCSSAGVFGRHETCPQGAPRGSERTCQSLERRPISAKALQGAATALRCGCAFHCPSRSVPRPTPGRVTRIGLAALIKGVPGLPRVRPLPFLTVQRLGVDDCCEEPMGTGDAEEPRRSDGSGQAPVRWWRAGRRPVLSG